MNITVNRLLPLRHALQTFRMMVVDSIDEYERFRDGIWVQGDTGDSLNAHICSARSTYLSVNHIVHSHFTM